MSGSAGRKPGRRLSREERRLFSDELMAIRPEPKYWFWDSAHPTYAAHMKMADFWIRAVSEQTAKFMLELRVD